MAIEKIAFDDTADMVVIHPVTGDELQQEDGSPMTITLYGAQSKQFRQAKNAAVNASMSKRGKAATAEQSERNAMQLLADCTAAFNGLDLGDGVLSVDDAADIYMDNPWLKDQVDEFIASNVNFLRRSKKR